MTLTVQRAATRRWWYWVAALTLAGLVVRVAYILLFRTDWMFLELNDGSFLQTKVGGDGYVFHQQANLIADGEGMISPINLLRNGEAQESADHPPLYTLYLTLWSMLGVRGTVSHMLVSAPLGALTATTFALLGRRVGGMSVGLVAAAFGAFAPSIIHYPGFILSETVTVPLAALAAWTLIRVVDVPTFGRAAALGFSIGAAIMARAEMGIYVIVAIIPVVMLIGSLRPIDRFVRLSVAGICCLVLVGPWVAYNLARFEEPVFLSIGLDYSLVQGNCDESYSDDLLGYYWLQCMGEALEGEFADDGTPLAQADQGLHSRFLRTKAFDYMKERPGRATQAAFARMGRITGVFHPIQQARLNAFIGGRENLLANVSVLAFYPTAVLAAAGAVLIARRRGPLWPLLGLIATAIIAVAMTLAVLRYRATAEPALAVLAAVALVATARFVRDAWLGDD